MRRVALIELGTTNVVIGCFFEVYNTLGYGFLEHGYGLALERELIARGRMVSRKVSIPVRYKGDVLTSQRVDLIVDDKVVVEIKSTHTLPPMARRQAFIEVTGRSGLEAPVRVHGAS